MRLYRKIKGQLYLVETKELRINYGFGLNVFSKLNRHYKKNSSGFKEWEQKQMLKTIYYFLKIYLFFYNNTNANPETVISKIKLFRANLRGVVDVSFFYLDYINFLLSPH